ncbi:AAA family ATPase [Actinocrinis puniceicyclus]|uniref:AAA family ATPase n=2 Tax=Actinocrinis puniceicyclus TaxID=977794 RepID=A0A8J8B976_9ACTN|nr:AAA family ATPase [Actinocrinis puniceicyclus]
MFYSYSGGVGRSGTVANLAMILANVGKRVLVVDLDLESPSQYRYLRAFLPQDAADAPDAPDVATLAAPLRLECVFRRPSGRVDLAGPLVDHVPDPSAYRVRREDLLGRGYDYVLIDAQAGAAGFADEANLDLPDVLVVCYNLFGQSIGGAVQQARAVQNRGGGPLRILPVPMKVDLKTGGLAERQRMYARRSFGWLLTDRDSQAQTAYWGNVEIPYVSDYSFDESLVGLDAPSEQRDALLNAYLRLTEELTAERLASPAAAADFPEPTRQRYRASRPPWMERDQDISVFYCPADRVWAEWIAAVLSGSGLSAKTRRVPGEGAPDPAGGESRLLVLSPAAMESPEFAQFVDFHAAQSSQRAAAVVCVEIGDAPLPERHKNLPRFRLDSTDGEGARTQLLAYFWSNAVPAAPSAQNAAPRYPRHRSPAESWNLPVRHPGFVGRDELIERIRDQLTGDPGQGLACAIVGPAGIGKSLVAIEYAYRFASQYDLVWIIPGDSAQSVQRGLAELAGPVGAPRGGNAPATVLEHLGRRFDERWLLIYDGVDDPASVENALPPPGRGHVLLTTRRSDLLGVVPIGVEALARQETLALICSLVAHIDSGDAAALAQCLDDQPLTVELAATWVRQVARDVRLTGLTDLDATREAVAEFTEQLADRMRPRADGAGGRDLLTHLVTLLLEQLPHDDWGAAALRLLETLACLSPVGAARRLVQSAAFVADLHEVEPGLSDPITLHNVLLKLVDYGFLPPDQAVRDEVRVHRRIMDVIRESMPPARRAARSRAVIEILAAFAPLGVDETTTRSAALYELLQPHVEYLDPEQATTTRARRWLADQVRYLWQTDESSAWNAALRLGERLQQAWRGAPDQAAAEPVSLTLDVQLANIHRSRGEFQLAHDLDVRVLARQRLLHGIKHIRTLLTARSYAADLRQLGQFEDALLEENSTWLAFREVLGDDHALTGVALNNLIVSHLLMGEAQQALDLSYELLEDSRTLAPVRPDLAARAMDHIGVCLRELGAYTEARDRLLDARDEWALLEGEKTRNAPSIVVLQAAANLAATMRRIDEVEPGLSSQTYASALEHYGRRHFATLICELGLAAQYHHDGKHGEAVESARECLDGFRAVFTDNHPYIGVCAVNLGRYAGYAQQWDVADAQGRYGLECLEERLGREHPWTAMAALAHAETLATLRRPADALALGRPALTALKATLATSHPVVQYAEQSLARIERLADRYPDTPRHAADTCRHHLEIDLPIFM